eukprot:gene31365-6526_t
MTSGLILSVADRLHDEARRKSRTSVSGSDNQHKGPCMGRNPENLRSISVLITDTLLMLPPPPTTLIETLKRCGPGIAVAAGLAMGITVLGVQWGQISRSPKQLQPLTYEEED